MTEKPNEIVDVTRICIKNIPPTFTESKLRSHLISNSQIPLVITDCKILRTKEGTSRKIGFVGFKTSEMATHAISFFDKSFAATSRLSVEAAFSKSNQTDYRPWSKHSKGSSRFDTTHEGEGGDEKSKTKNDMKKKSDDDAVNSEIERKKQEFIDVMMGGKKTSSNLFWANDDGLRNDKEETTRTSKAKESNIEDDDTSSDSNSDLESSDSDSDDESVDIMKTDKQHMSDMDFLRSKVVNDKGSFSDNDEHDGEVNRDAIAASDNGHSSTSDSSDSDDSHSKSVKDMESSAVKDSQGDNSEQKIVTNARLFIRNLPFSATEEELKDFFSGYGNIIECHIPVDDTNRNKGYAFIKFSSNDEALNALQSLDATSFQGRLMHILPAKEEHNSTPKADENSMDKNWTHKERKELERQKDAGNMKGWNASFIRGDAVVDNLASRLGLEKGSILNVKDDLTAGNAAVRLALGETQVIEENRTYFQKHGIDIDGLVSSSSDTSNKRSSNMILVKNLPFDTSLEELSKVFIAVNGKRPQVLLPPSRTVALIIFPNNSDAKKAFRKLAYKRFKNVPLYLEWASVTMTPTPDATAQEEVAMKGKILDDNMAKEDEEVMDDDEFYSIYVKNLNFRTSEETLKSAFEEKVGRVRSVRIPTKASAVKAVRGIKPQSDEEPLRQSMGFGFVEFNSKADAKKALSLLQGKIIDGHEIEVSMSKSKSQPSSKTSGEIKKPGTKIIIRNVPFQASRTELLQLFGSFGHLKTVRLPKKYDGGHRGFAFVEFSSTQEALNAMKALASTHLYGRHLVLEWASDSNDIDSLRDKTKRESESSGLLSSSSNKKIRTK